MDDVFPDCEVLLLDDAGRTTFCAVSAWHGRESARRMLATFSAIPYRRYEIWRGLELVAADTKRELRAVA